jgi:site-specific DNA-methyltransferase (adenine-specific)
MSIEVIKGDCLIESDKIESGSVDLILTDLPYGNMNTDGGRKLGINGWDLAIEPKKVFEIANRILRKNGKMVLFSQEPYTTRLINNQIWELPFNYRATWEKDNFAVALGAKVNMVSFTEDVLIFSKTYENEINATQQYLNSELVKSGKQKKDFYLFLSVDIVGHTFTKPNRYAFPTQKTYEKIQKIAKGFFTKEYKELKEINESNKNKFASTFNLWEGNKYKSNILKYKKDYDGHHPTQKPILLLEDLIKTFSNENDLVVDLTMGSGSTGVAAKSTNRNFIGIEMDENYFNIASDRIKQLEYKLL